MLSSQIKFEVSKTMPSTLENDPSQDASLSAENYLEEVGWEQL